MVARLSLQPAVESPQGRARYLALAVALPIAAMAPWLAWALAAPSPLGNFSDSIDYLVLAEYYARYFRGEPAGYTLDYFGQSRFPPLFPLLLASIGATPLNPFPALVATNLLTIAAIMAFAAWYLDQTRRVAVAALLALAGFVSAGQLLLQLNPMSEPLMQLLVGAILLQAARRPARGSSLLVLAAMVGVLPMARMAGVAMVAAFAIWMLRGDRTSGSQRLAGIAVAALPALAWIAYRSLLPIEESYVDALTLERALAAFGGWSGLLAQPLQVLTGLAGAFAPEPGTFHLAAASLIVLLAAVALPSRLRANALDAWFVPIYAGLVAIWPYPAEMPRLMLVLVPVLVLQAWSGAAHLAKAAARSTFLEPHGLPLVAALIVLACIPGWWHFVQRTRLPVAPALEPYRRSPAYFIAETDSLAIEGAESWARIVAMAAELPQVVPRADCVYTVFPAMIWVQSGQRTRVKALTPKDADSHRSPETFTECRYFMAVNLRSLQSGVPPLFPLAVLRDQTSPVLYSEFEHREQRVVAAALIERIEPRAADSSR